MAGRMIDHLQGTIAAASATGYITLASVVGFYRNAVVYLNNTGQPTKRAVITDILSGTNQLGILFREIAAGTVPTYGHSDVSAYNGGTVTQHEQFVYNVNDKPLD